MSQKFIKQFFIGSGLLLVICALVIVIFDPFFHYHKPISGLKEVLNEKEYQVPGTLKNFEYDSVIAGSSVAENYNNHWFDEGFDCTSVKAIRSYGATADLCYFLDMAFKHRELKYVFYNLDPSSLVADPEPTYELTGSPMYLYDEIIINDIEYLLNKDVLMEKVPYLIANSVIGDYDEGNSYNWSQWKQFNEAQALSLYPRKPSVDEMKPKDYYQEELQANLSLLTAQIEAHPETTFYIFVPPYSMLWWDNVYRNGETEAHLYNMEQAMETLLAYDNVKFFYFQNDREIITNLDNYMDTLHFSQDINHYICLEMIAGTHEITKDNLKEQIEDMRMLSYEITEELILPYEDKMLIDTSDD